MDDERRRLELPDRRKNTYEALEKRLDEHIAKIEKRLAKWFRRGLIAYAIIGIAVTVALVGYGFVLDEIRNTREEFVRRDCEATNSRHDQATNALIAGSDEDIEKAPTPEAKAEIRRRRDVTLALINTVTPVQDCDYQVDLAFDRVEPTPTPTPPKAP